MCGGAVTLDKQFYWNYNVSAHLFQFNLIQKYLINPQREVN